MAGNIVENFTEKDITVGNTGNVIEADKGIFISVLSTHINLDTAGRLFGTKEIIKGVFRPVVTINGNPVILITPEEAKLYNDKTPLTDILSKH